MAVHHIIRCHSTFCARSISGCLTYSVGPAFLSSSQPPSIQVAQVLHPCWRVPEERLLDYLNSCDPPSNSEDGICAIFAMKKARTSQSKRWRDFIHVSNWYLRIVYPTWFSQLRSLYSNVGPRRGSLSRGCWSISRCPPPTGWNYSIQVPWILNSKSLLPFLLPFHFLTLQIS